MILLNASESPERWKCILNVALFPFHFWQKCININSSAQLNMLRFRYVVQKQPNVPLTDAGAFPFCLKYACELQEHNALSLRHLNSKTLSVCFTYAENKIPSASVKTNSSSCPQGKQFQKHLFRFQSQERLNEGFFIYFFFFYSWLLRNQIDCFEWDFSDFPFLFLFFKVYLWHRAIRHLNINEDS